MSFGGEWVSRGWSGGWFSRFYWHCVILWSKCQTSSSSSCSSRSCSSIVSRARGVRARSKAGRRGPRRARGRGRSQGGGAAAQDYDVCLSCEDPDVENVLPPLNPSHPTGVFFGFPLLRSTMNTAVHFLNLFFTVEMIDMIVQCTNSNVWKHIVGESFQCNALPDGKKQPLMRSEGWLPCPSILVSSRLASPWTDTGEFSHFTMAYGLGV